MKQFAIWSEGYIATGESGGAHFHGYSSGNTFKEACNQFAIFDSQFKQFYDPNRITFWGCRLFDNESDARRNFG